MSLIIPVGIFARYVLGTGSQWPEPIAILLMVIFTFFGAAAGYRAGAHIAVAMVTDRMPPALQRACAMAVDMLMLVISLFMLWYGAKLCLETMGQSLAALPWMPVGLTYLPLPIGGCDHLLFVLEKLVFGAQHAARGGPLRPRTKIAERGLIMDAFVLLGSFMLLILIGMPVAYSLGLAALIGALWIDMPLDAVMIQIASGVNKFSLLAIPFFVLAGAIMAEGGMSRRLVAFASVLVGFVRGGLSLVNILASTFFGAISGSSMADTASIGSVLIPEMEKKGYPRDFATAVTVSGSVQAILIPPSHNAVIYSMAAGGSMSIAALFMAGVLPGLLLGLTLADHCLFIASKRNFPKGQRSRCARRCRSASTRCGA